MSLAEKAATIASNVPRCYEAGRKSEYDKFWDALQAFGNRTEYRKTFIGKGWTQETFKPKYDIVPVENVYMMFQDCGTIDLVKTAEECGITIDFSKTKDFLYLLYCSGITHIGEVNVSSASSIGSLFGFCIDIETIDKITGLTASHTTDGAVFTQCSNLTNVRFEGELGGDLRIQWSTKLTRESLLSLLQVLCDYSEDTSGTAHTITLGETNKAKLTEEELNIAINKGWGVE